jgi:hypothetical protein
VTVRLRPANPSFPMSAHARMQLLLQKRRHLLAQVAVAEQGMGDQSSKAAQPAASATTTAPAPRVSRCYSAHVILHAFQ